MRKIRYISAQPATDYYKWQVEVMINNFVSMGINPNDMDIVCWKQNGVIPEDWSKLAHKYPARFFFYDDTRENRHYISSIRPNILKQHFRDHPYLELDAIFYHDCDIIFTKNPTQWITFEMVQDGNWYGSDVRWYIGHDYILSKGEDILDKMCEIMEIPKELVKENELNCIGAQYLMKGINHHFWDWVETKCDTLFHQITELNNEKVALDRHTVNEGEPNRAPYHPLQIWCSDMWAVLWKGWLMGYKTIPHQNYDFSWGTSSETDYHKMNIMHNAGVTNSTSGYFYKAEYINKLPYNTAVEPNRETASWHYWNWIQKTAQTSCLI